ncbi:MAG: lipoxygenase family protein, partial [Pseudomonadota bacterium]
RAEETEPAKQGLSNRYTIGGVTAEAITFLYGDGSDVARQQALNDLLEVASRRPTRIAAALLGLLARMEDKARVTTPRSPSALPLDAPDQWSISWTNYHDVYRDALPQLPAWASTLTDPDEASRQFWPTIARYGFAYNLLLPKKVDDAAALKRQFAERWEEEWERAAASGALYLIDLSIFASLPTDTVAGFDRFTPSTMILLRQDPVSKTLIPIAVRVAGHDDRDARLFTRSGASDSAWLYALQAAKTSITVYGIWLGHVYHWHIVTASMLMTMNNSLPKDHPLYLMLTPQSDYLIQFDEILLLLWDFIAPPSSVGSPLSFLRLTDRFAEGRSFFDDDPRSTLRHLGIEQADFSWQQPWDQYPIVADYLTIWQAVEDYVDRVVDASYAGDRAVADDRALQKWMAAASDPHEGNIRGLPAMTDRQALCDVLTSLLYRIVAHGSSRLNAAANPALTFVANFPPCLQDTSIPATDATFETEKLLAYLPRTGTIGLMVTFYFTFVFSASYVPLIPKDGVEADLFFPGGPDEPRNRALVAFRRKMVEFMEGFQPAAPQIHQWPMNIET